MLELWDSEWLNYLNRSQKLSVVTKNIALNDKISIILPTRNNERPFIIQLNQFLIKVIKILN